MHVCARCPKVLGKSCCEVQEGQHLAMVTRGDVARISEHTGLAARRFIVEEWLTEAEAADYERRRPLYRGYFRARPLRWTLAQRGRACVFLDPRSGCRLPRDVRPLACRLYPFERWPDGGWSVQVGRYGDEAQAREEGDACLAVEEALAMEDVLAAFGCTEAEVEALGARLAREADAHGKG